MNAMNQFKEMQKQIWSLFTPFEMVTMRAASRLVQFAEIERDKKVLDVGCGTGVVAVTSACRGARVSGLDLSSMLRVDAIGLIRRARRAFGRGHLRGNRV